MVSLLLIAAFALASPINSYFDSRNISHIALFDTQAVSILGQNRRDIRLTRENGCIAKTKVAGGMLTVWARPEAGCQTALSFIAPPATSLSIRSTTGRVQIIGLAGSIEVNQESGDVSIDGGARSLDVRLASGVVAGTNLIHDAKIWLGRGNISLEFASVSAKSKIEIKTGDANASVWLPAGTSVRTQRRIKFGTYTSDFPEATRAELTVAFQSEMGNLAVRRKAAALP